MNELQPRDFSFNAPYGACPDRLGIGSREEVDPSLVIPDKTLSLEEGAVAPFRTGNYYPQVMRAVLRHSDVDPSTPWEDIPNKVQKALLYGLEFPTKKFALIILRLMDVKRIGLLNGKVFVRQ